MSEGVAHAQAARRGVGRANDRAGRVIIRRPRALKALAARLCPNRCRRSSPVANSKVLAEPRPVVGVLAAGVGRRHVQQRRKVENVVGQKVV